MCTWHVSTILVLLGTSRAGGVTITGALGHVHAACVRSNDETKVIVELRICHDGLVFMQIVDQ